MDVEKIAALIQQMSGDAARVFIVYLVVKYVVSVILCFAGWIIIIKLVANATITLVDKVSRSVGIVKQIRDKMKIGSKGSLIDTEIQCVQNDLHKLFDNVFDAMS